MGVIRALDYLPKVTVVYFFTCEKGYVATQSRETNAEEENVATQSRDTNA